MRMKLPFSVSNYGSLFDTQGGGRGRDDNPLPFL